jgi:heme A synthase
LNSSVVLRVTGAALGVQVALGGLVTFGFLDASVHIIWGIVVGVLAIASLVSVAKLSPRPKRLFGLAIGVGVDILVQALIGFAAMATTSIPTVSGIIAWFHLLNAFAIFAMFIPLSMAKPGEASAAPASPTKVSER